MVESLWWRSYQGLRFLLSIQAQRLTSGGCQGNLKSAPVDLSVHAVSLLRTSAFFGILSGGRRHWAAALKSGHAVQRKRCGSLNRSFSYWEAARSLRPPLPTLGKRLLEPRGPLVGAFRRSSGQLFPRNRVAKMEWVPRRQLGRAFSSKILGLTVKS